MSVVYDACVCVCVRALLLLFIGIVQRNWACLTWKSAIEIKSLLSLLLLWLAEKSHVWKCSCCHLHGLVDMVTDELVNLLVARVQLLGIHLGQLLQGVRHHTRRWPRACRSAPTQGGCPCHWHAAGVGLIHPQAAHTQRYRVQGRACGCSGWVCRCIHAFHPCAIRRRVTGEGEGFHLQQSQDVITQELHLQHPHQTLEFIHTHIYTYRQIHT